MVEVKLRQSDLPPNHRKPIQDAIVLLHQRIIQRGDEGRSLQLRWGDFARALRKSLDESFGPAWHVLTGVKLGFACKKRNGCMGLWRLGDSMVIIWKSPGLEEPLPPDQPPAAEQPAEAPSGATAPTLRVLQPSVVEAGSDLERAVAVLRAEVARTPSEDLQVFAQRLRRSLTEELGAIWHVAAGSEFAMEPAEDCRNFVVVVAGKLRVACFQHEQLQAGRFIDHIDFKKLLNAAPYLCVVVFFFIYITLQSICQEGAGAPTRGWAAFVRARACRPHWENDLGTLAACVGGGLFIARRLLRPRLPHAKRA